MIFYFSGVFGTRERVEPPTADEFRVATWNTGWLLEEVREDRCRQMTRVIERLKPHVLALQEVESKMAVRKILPVNYKVAMADDPKEDQELALAFAPEFRLLHEHKVLFPEARHDDAFPSRRNALQVTLKTPSDEEIVFIVIHYKSRSPSRKETDDSRILASRLILDYLRQKKYKNVIILGDFNDTPGDKSVDVLESGDVYAQSENRFLINLFEDRYRSDFVSQGVFRKFRGVQMTPQVRGASQDNERLRGKDYAFPRDVRVTQALFDQILVSPNLASRANEVKIFAEPVAMMGRESRVNRD